MAGFKRDFKEQLSAAKAEVADSNRDIRKELETAQRQMQQSKKRADNNHKIYIIARAQALLAEKRLLKHEPDYKPIVALPTSNEAIDEVIKKFVTYDAREHRASQDILSKEQAIGELNDKLKSLESENAALKAQKSSGNLGDDLDLDSIDSIDLIVKMKEFMPADKGNVDPSIFKTVKTVQDVVDALVPYMA